MFEVHPYNKKGARDLLRLLRKHRRVVAASPTGSGKTVLAAELVRMLKGKRVLFLAHKIELIRQAYAQLRRAGIPQSLLGILSSVEKENTAAPILVASVNMFRARPVPKVDLFIVDEAHHIVAKTYRSVLDAWPKALVLGLTATPERLDGKPLREVFAHLHVVATEVELIADKYLLGAMVFGITQEEARLLVKGAKSTKRDYSQRALEAMMNKRPLMGDVVAEYQRIALGKRALVYACNREHARKLLKRFRAAGIPAAYIDSDTPAKERAALLGPQGKLARGAVHVVVSVEVILEGFDCPPVSVIICARPTKSLVLWRQMCGRGARYRRGKRFLVLDHAGNSWRLGFPDEPKDWSLDGRPKGDGPAPKKMCVQEGCTCLMHIAAKVCPACGHEQPMSERQLQEARAQLKLIQESNEARERRAQILKKLATVRGLDQNWVEQALNGAA